MADAGHGNGPGAPGGARKQLNAPEFELPVLPQEGNILSHQATQWIEDAEAILRGKGLLEVSMGGLPSAARNIVDTPVSVVPPEGGMLSRRDDQQRLSILSQNERNRLAREELMLKSWTSLYVALLFSAKDTCPLLYEQMKKLCTMTNHNPQWGEYNDGPRAWKMVLFTLRGRPRTKKDRDFYRGALSFQMKHRPQVGCTSAEYGKYAPPICSPRS